MSIQQPPSDQPITTPPQYGYPPGMYPPPGQPGYPPPGQPGYPPPGSYPPPSPGYQPPQEMVEMPPPVAPTKCPPGLEYLNTIDQLLVHQTVERLEVLTGCESKNKYEVKNSFGQQIYFAKEDNDCLTRNCCGPMRPFDMKITNNYHVEVIHLYRPLRCDSCCCPCCLQRIEVMSPPGTVIGYVTEEWSILVPKYHVENAAGECVLRIKGPLCTNLCGDVEFQVLSKDGEHEVGKITKQWSGLAKKLFTDASNFGITFSMDLDVNIKAVLLGACFLIDFIFKLS